MTLEQFLDRTGTPERSLVVVNRTEPEPFQRMLENLFEDQDVTVDEADADEYDENTVLLLEDGEVVATSPMQELQDAVLMVNSDLFITGTQSLEDVEVPDVLDGLAESQFSLRGYPESDSEKLLLILVSRHIERRAFERGEGRLRSSFQFLSRIEDERGTRRVYERIAGTDVDVHVYGRPNWTPSPEFPVTMHGGHKPDFRDSWFVIYRPPEHDQSVTPAALLAIEREANVWDGFWTYDESLVADLAEYIRHNL